MIWVAVGLALNSIAIFANGGFMPVAASAMTSSVRFPSVALSNPPTESPVLAATASVAELNSVAKGTIASTDSRNRYVWASGASC